MAINISDFDKIWASTSPLTPYSFSENNYKQGWNFVGATPPARQMWDSYMKWSDEKQQYIVQNFLPLSGGTMTGAIDFSNGKSKIRHYSNSLYVVGEEATNNTYLSLFDNATASGFTLQAGDGTTYKRLLGKPDGTFTWDGQPIQTSSDRNIKTDFADVPADILDKWENVKWQQFHYKDAKETKGDSCRFHIGLVAQDVEESCGEEILKYGILCKEDEMWMVRYTEALCMEVAYLRKKIADMEERITKLEK